MNIHTDEAVRLGRDILSLKKLLGVPSHETNFEIFQHNNSKIWLRSRFIHSKNLDLRIGGYKLKFCYGLNELQEVVLLYCPRCNNRAFYRFEGADPLLKYLNGKYISKLTENYDKLSARITSMDKSKNVVESSNKEDSKSNTIVVPFQKRRFSRHQI